MALVSEVFMTFISVVSSMTVMSIVSLRTLVTGMSMMTLITYLDIRGVVFFWSFLPVSMNCSF
jgi:hypothetical protein